MAEARRDLRNPVDTIARYNCNEGMGEGNKKKPLDSIAAKGAKGFSGERDTPPPGSQRYRVSRGLDESGRETARVEARGLFEDEPLRENLASRVAPRRSVSK